MGLAKKMDTLKSEEDRRRSRKLPYYYTNASKGLVTLTNFRRDDWAYVSKPHPPLFSGEN